MPPKWQVVVKKKKNRGIFNYPEIGGASQSIEIKCCNNTATTTVAATATMAMRGGNNPTFRSAFIVGDNNGEAMQMPAAHKASHPLFQPGVAPLPAEVFEFFLFTPEGRARFPPRALFPLFTLLLARRNVCIARPAEWPTGTVRMSVS